MELPNNLKKTLDKTFDLALRLEGASSMIVPRKIGARGRKRLLNINREIKNLSTLMKLKPSNNESPNFRTFDHTLNSTLKSKKEIITDSSGQQIKRKLSLSIKEMNQRVRLSRAGKKSIGKYITDLNMTSPISRDLTTLHSSNNRSTSRMKYTDLTEEKPQPYISLTSGKIEDPIVLPSFSEFLQAKGEEFVARKGKDELVFRIVKATEQIDRLEENLNQKIFSIKNNEEKKIFHKRNSLLASKSYKREENAFKINKKNDLRSVMNQYFNMPSYYSSPTNSKSTRRAEIFTEKSEKSLSAEAKATLEGTLRNFYKSKAVENKKLSDILEKISVDRPFYIQQKLKFIQNDKEKYKNKHHSIEKFNGFREKIEKTKRDQQYKNYEQGLVYLEILDEFKRKKCEPTDCELLILELWKRMVESGYVVSQHNFEEMTSILTESELSGVENLLDKFYAICY